jgi:ADP-ribose pyrophosphatase YjhB (NUDIX family)
MSPLTEQLLRWADTLRDLSALGLRYANNVYDRERYRTIQHIVLDMMATATERPLAHFEALRSTLFLRPSPIVAGAAAVIDERGRIVLIERADTHHWGMPAGMMEVGETPAEGVTREAFEETGIRCRAVALVGVYDSWKGGAPMGQHTYKFTFLCQPLTHDQEYTPFSQEETVQVQWFTEEELPAVLVQGHKERIADAYRVWRGETRAYFDQ